MKPKEIKPKFVFRILDRNTGEARGAYSRSCCTEYDFESAVQARNSNVHDIYWDDEAFKVAKYEVTYKLVEDDVKIPKKYMKEKPETLEDILLDICKKISEDKKHGNSKML